MRNAVAHLAKRVRFHFAKNRHFQRCRLARTLEMSHSRRYVQWPPSSRCAHHRRTITTLAPTRSTRSSTSTFQSLISQFLSTMSTRFFPRRRAFSIFAVCCALSAAHLAAVSAQTQTPPIPSQSSTASPAITIQNSQTSGDPTAIATPATPTVTSPDAQPTAAPSVSPTVTATASPDTTASPDATPKPATPKTAATPKTLPTTGVALSVLAREAKLPLPLPNARIVIVKAQRRLELWNGGQLVKTYQVALGANPVGAKSREHDGRTPEGHFRICTRNSTNSAFHIFLGLSYPDVPDAARGVNSGVLSWREYTLINRRLASRGAPLWDTRLGGWVGIHGGTGSPFAQKQAAKRGRNDWTAGCIALTDREIEELYSATKMGTPVWIQP